MTSLSARTDTPQRLKSEGDRQRFALLARPSDCDLVLRKIHEVLELTPIKMARLIGLTSTSNAYHWINGRHRPSQLYVLRMAYLLCLTLEGVSLKRVRTIDWNTYQIEWWDGAKPDERKTVAGQTWRDLPAPEREAD